MKPLTLALLLALLMPRPTGGATLTIQKVYRGTCAVASIVASHQGCHSDTTVGPYQISDEFDDAGVDSIAHAHADLDSDIGLSGNVLSVSGSGNCNISLSLPAGGNGVANAQSQIMVEFYVDAPFNFSMQSASSGGSTAPTLNSVRIAKLPNMENPITGNSSGTLPAGSYQFLAISTVQLTPPLASISDSANFQAILSVSPRPLTCADLIQGAVNKSATPDGFGIQAVFTPNFGATLAEAATTCNVDHFNWLQWVIYDDDPMRPPDCNGNLPSVPYFDPPFCGYDYQLPTGSDHKFGYWNEDNGQLASYTTGTSLRFVDYPLVTPGSKVRFRTSLIGVDSTGTVKLKGDVFSWESTSTGVSSIRQNVDPSLVQNANATLLGSLDPSQLPLSEHKFLREHGIQAPLPLPDITSVTFDGATLNLSISNLVQGTTNYVESSENFAVWSNVGSFLGSWSGTNWSRTDTNWPAKSFFRISSQQ